MSGWERLRYVTRSRGRLLRERHQDRTTENGQCEVQSQLTRGKICKKESRARSRFRKASAEIIVANATARDFRRLSISENRNDKVMEMPGREAEPPNFQMILREECPLSPIMPTLVEEYPCKSTPAPSTPDESVSASAAGPTPCTVTSVQDGRTWTIRNKMVRAVIGASGDVNLWRLQNGISDDVAYVFGYKDSDDVWYYVFGDHPNGPLKIKPIAEKPGELNLEDDPRVFYLEHDERRGSVGSILVSAKHNTAVSFGRGDRLKLAPPDREIPTWEIS